VEPCKQYRSTVEFNFIDSTVLINLGDPCKRALSAVEKIPEKAAEKGDKKAKCKRKVEKNLTDRTVFIHV
jgi:hypothetical protein